MHRRGMLGGVALFIVIALLFVVTGEWTGPADHASPVVGGALSEPQQRAEGVLGPAYVRDGDTIVVEDVPVRLQGLHCPERDEPGGSTATQAMQRLTQGQNVRCSLTGERTYDRIVGTCYVGDTDLTAAMIRQSVCARCPRYDPWMRYLPAQLQAGSWNGSMPGYCR